MSKLKEIEAQFEEYKELYEDGNLSDDEYIDLLKSLDLSNEIAESAEELEYKETLNVLITGAIITASAV